MATWTPPTQLVTGQNLSQPVWNAVATNETFLWEKPYVSIFDNSGTPVGSGGLTICQLGGVSFIQYGWTVLDGNTLSVPVAGTYQFNFRVGFGAADGGGGYSALFHNGAVIAVGSWVNLFSDLYILNGSIAQSVGSVLFPCNAGDTVFLACYQNSGGDVDCLSGSTNTALDSFLVGSL